MGRLRCLVFVLSAVGALAVEETTGPWVYVRNKMDTRANEDGAKHVRCYCNLPSCMATGHMCKSPLGGCFSHLHADSTRARHGCIETVEDGNHKARCMNSPSGSAVWAVSGSANPGHAAAAASGSLVLCCFRDLCNHNDSSQTHLRLNETASSNVSGFHNTLGQTLGSNPGIGASEANAADMWFRVATIAVPICGAVILFLLIAIAVKLLRTDALDISNKLSATYTPHETRRRHLEQPLMKKAMPQRSAIFGELPSPEVVLPLFPRHSNVTNVCETAREHPTQAKNEMNAKINSAASLDSESKENLVIMQHYSQIVSQQSSPLHKPTNTDLINSRDINVNLSSQPDSDSTECTNNKLYSKQPLPLPNKMYNNEGIIYWGQASANANSSSR